MPQNNKQSHLILTVFTISLLYWIYLSFICQMYLWHDALGYEDLGDRLYRHGWLNYFKTGPHREPLYPWLISLSMHIGNYLSTSYKTIQMFIQILLLLATQTLTYQLLKKLKIKPWITAITLLYLAFSPAMFISTYRLYSEIATYPFILSIILFSVQGWKNIFSSNPSSYFPIIYSAIGLGLSFLGVVFVKGIFELIAPMYALPFIVFTLLAFWKKHNPLGTKALIFCSLFFISFYGPLNSYKMANKIHNGKFTLTNRGPWALYGNTARRMEPLTTQRFLMALAYVPRPEGCYTLFGKEACQFWHYSESDKFGHHKAGELHRKGLSAPEVDKMLIKLSIQKALTNPFQYALFGVIEGFKLFFWEFTSMAYVVYPDWMIKLFYFTPLHLGLNGLMGLLSFLALLFLGLFTWKNKNTIFTLNQMPDEPTLVIFSLFSLISSTIALHSFFFVLPRYVFPIVPLYLISIAFLIQQGFKINHAKT